MLTIIIVRAMPLKGCMVLGEGFPHATCGTQHEVLICSIVNDVY